MGIQANPVVQTLVILFFILVIFSLLLRRKKKAPEEVKVITGKVKEIRVQKQPGEPSVVLLTVWDLDWKEHKLGFYGTGSEFKEGDEVEFSVNSQVVGTSYAFRSKSLENGKVKPMTTEINHFRVLDYRVVPEDTEGGDD